MDEPKRDDVTDDDEVVEHPSVDAPADSHLKCYRLTDRLRAKISGPSELFVTFRETVRKKDGQRRPEVTYRYESHDHIALRQIFERMTVASSPGEIIHSDLISAGNKGSPV